MTFPEYPCVAPTTSIPLSHAASTRLFEPRVSGTTHRMMRGTKRWICPHVITLDAGDGERSRSGETNPREWRKCRYAERCHHGPLCTRLKFAREFRNLNEQIANETIIGYAENRCFGVLVDCDD